MLLTDYGIDEGLFGHQIDRITRLQEHVNSVLMFCVK